MPQGNAQLPQVGERYEPLAHYKKNQEKNGNSKDLKGFVVEAVFQQAGRWRVAAKGDTGKCKTLDLDLVKRAYVPGTVPSVTAAPARVLWTPPTPPHQGALYVAPDEKIANVEHRRVPLSQLVQAAFEPPSRTTEKAVLNLMASIRQEGVRNDITVIRDKSGRFLMADGHRRAAAVTLLGWETAPVCVQLDASPADLPKLFSLLNSQTRSMSSFEWLVAKLADVRIKLPSKHNSDYNEALRIFGSPAAVRTVLADNGLGAAQVTGINKAFQLIAVAYPQLLAPGARGVEPGSPLSAADVGAWMADLQQSFRLRKLLEAQDEAPSIVRVRMLLNCIRRGEPLP